MDGESCGRWLAVRLLAAAADAVGRAERCHRDGFDLTVGKWDTVADRLIRLTVELGESAWRWLDAADAAAWVTGQVKALQAETRQALADGHPHVADEPAITVGEVQAAGRPLVDWAGSR